MRLTAEMEVAFLRALDRCEFPAVTGKEHEELRRIALTLHRWDEEECNGTIEMDEETGKAFRVYNIDGPGPIKRYPIPNRYAGALRRLAKLLPEGYTFEVQGDPRGWPLTIKAPNGCEVSPPPFPR